MTWYRIVRRFYGPLLALAVVASVVACLSAVVVPADAPPSVKYYAVLSDYNTAKLVAVRFVQTPSTSASEGRKILAVVEEADQKIRDVDLEILRGGDLNSTYTVAAAILRVAATELRRIAVTEGGSP